MQFKSVPFFLFRLYEYKRPIRILSPVYIQVFYCIYHTSPNISFPILTIMLIYYFSIFAGSVVFFESIRITFLFTRVYNFSFLFHFFVFFFFFFFTFYFYFLRMSFVSVFLLFSITITFIFGSFLLYYYHYTTR